jgi:hypothetical protein
MLARLHACHCAPNTPLRDGLVKASRAQVQQHRPRRAATPATNASGRGGGGGGGGGASAAAAAAAPTAAAAQPQQRWRHADYTRGVGDALRAGQLCEAVALVERWLDAQQRVHGVATGEVLEGACWCVCVCVTNSADTAVRLCACGQRRVWARQPPLVVG